jgi:hypothetical protein
METIITLAQYADAQRREYASANGVTLARMLEAYPTQDYADEYREAVCAAIEAGNVPTFRVWRTWPEDFRNSIFRLWRVRTDDSVSSVLIGFELRCA